MDDNTIDDSNFNFPSTPEPTHNSTLNNSQTHHTPNSQNANTTHNTTGNNNMSMSASPHTTDKVQRVAQNIYAELENNLKNFGEDSIKSLIPLLAGLIEDYQTALTNKEKLACEIELQRR